jgi:hypothetical protein
MWCQEILVHVDRARPRTRGELANVSVFSHIDNINTLINVSYPSLRQGCEEPEENEFERIRTSTADRATLKPSDGLPTIISLIPYDKVMDSTIALPESRRNPRGVSDHLQ